MRIEGEITMQGTLMDHLFLLKWIKKCGLALVLIIALPSNATTAVTDEKLCAYVFAEKGEDFVTRVRAAFRDPMATCLDFSSAHLSDDDLETILQGLVDRTELDNPAKLRLLTLGIGEEGVVSLDGLVEFLTRVQRHGRTAGGRMFSVIKETILETGLPITTESVERVENVARLLFARGLRLME